VLLLPDQHIFLLQSTGVNRVTKYLLDLHPDDLQNVDDFSPFWKIAWKSVFNSE